MTAGRLAGKTAVVTGGGNGIGRACCQRFAEQGASVVVADLLADNAAETVELVAKDGGEAVSFELDAADESANVALMATAIETFGSIDVLVTAAGISHADYRSGDRGGNEALVQRTIEAMADPPNAFLEFSLEAWQRVLDVNLTGTMLAVHAAAAHMVSAGNGGSIITVASVAAKNPDAGPLPYAVSKAGVWMLTKSAARMLGPAGIRVNAIGPGFIQTNMTQLLTEIPGVQEMFTTALPLRRLGQPSEIADAALFLASDESSYFTGEILHPDGGYFTG
ncbi:MAG: SDR family oxidoreductase [Actinomycetota bacterium]|nr:SDR family oxidoreductase [Actinomycetota bacterium]